MPINVCARFPEIRDKRKVPRQVNLADHSFNNLSMDHQWTTGGNSDIICLNRMGASGSGEVFRVCPAAFHS